MNNPTKSLFTLFLLFIAVNTFGQNLNEQQLIGTWSVVNIEDTLPITDSEKQNLQTFLNAFKKSTFELESNKNFTFHINSKKIEDNMKQLHWKYNKNQSKVIVQDWKNKDNSEDILMELDVEMNMGKIFFQASAPPLVFKIKKESDGGKKK